MGWVRVRKEERTREIESEDKKHEIIGKIDSKRAMGANSSSRTCAASLSDDDGKSINIALQQKHSK